MTKDLKKIGIVQARGSRTRLNGWWKGGKVEMMMMKETEAEETETLPTVGCSDLSNFGTFIVYLPFFPLLL